MNYKLLLKVNKGYCENNMRIWRYKDAYIVISINVAMYF